MFKTSKNKPWSFFFASILVLLMLCSVVSAASIDIKIENTNNINISKAIDKITGYEVGVIDWSKNKIQATGVGYASRNLPPDADKSLIYNQAKTAAEVVSQRNLLGVIKGVMIDSKTIVNLSELETDEIRRVISGTLNGVTIVDEEPYGDKGYKVTAEIDVSKLMKLKKFQKAKKYFVN